MTKYSNYHIPSFVTIVIPCKNEEKYIGMLLYDLYTQSQNSFKIIVADGGSTDSTLEVVHNCKVNLGLNIRVVPGGNVSEGRNTGAQYVTTPYILFIDADVRLFNRRAIEDCVSEMIERKLHLMTLKIKNYSNDLRASFLFSIFNVINKIMSRKTPFAIGAFFLTDRNVFNMLGGFPNKYETSEDYILSKQYNPKYFSIGHHYFGQDDRRFKRLGYIGMMKYMITNFFNRNNLTHFEKSSVNYWNT
jgi:glycosyltransferase involved in cell wall biosynthesis